MNEKPDLLTEAMRQVVAEMDEGGVAPIREGIAAMQDRMIPEDDHLLLPDTEPKAPAPRRAKR